MITRLQLGISRLENLDSRVLERFLDKSWIHLGDEESPRKPRTLSHYYRALRAQPLEFVRSALQRAARRRPNQATSSRDLEELYASTNFRPFYFQKGNRLPFDDGSLDYVFSEHFIHHLFLPDAFALFRIAASVLIPAA